MSGRVTMLGISRWAGKGGSYRTIQRFFYTTICWPNLLWVFFRHHCWHRDDTYLLVGDEVVVTKAGKQTHGLGRFFSSLYKRPVPGLAFFSLSLVSIEQRQSFPVRIEQVVRPTPPPAKATPPQTKPTAKKRGPGRPKGSKNKDKTAVRLNRELLHIKGMIAALFDLIAGAIAPTHLALDGHFGNNLELSYQKLIDYYSLRFQIEFNFRDAKQFWGLEDFMNTTETAVTNAVNLSFFMVNLSSSPVARLPPGQLRVQPS